MSKELVRIVKARNWALASFNNIFKNPFIHINVSDYPEEYAIILQDVPQHYNCVKIPRWYSNIEVIDDMKYVIYDKDVVDDDNDNDDVEQNNLYLYNFQDKDQIYYGVYNEEGKRVSDKCLILHDKDVSSIYHGYAPGRCPDVIEKIEL